MNIVTTHCLSLSLLVSGAAAQIIPGHAIVITEMNSTPKSVLLDVDLTTGMVATFSRFGFDDNVPLGVSVDPVDRDLIVAIHWQNGTRILRLPVQGRVIGAPRVLADVGGKITDLELGFGDSIFFTIDGNSGGLFGVPRNGGTVRRVTAMPRARGIFNFGHGVYSGFILQAGAAGQPGTNPRISAVNYANGQVLSTTSLVNYGPIDVTDAVVLPNAVLNKLVTNADGTVGEVALNRSTVLNLTPKLPAGATRRIRTFGGGFTPYVLGGKAHPRIKTFPAFANGGNRPWTMLTGNLPGDPVDFDIAMAPGAKIVGLGRACRTAGLHIGTTQRPRIGNGAFNLQLHFGAGNALAVLALGLSDDRFGNLALPASLVCSCRRCLCDRANVWG